MLLAASSALAADIVIVRTSDAEPYTQADTALRLAFAQHNYNVKSLLAREASDKGIDSSIGKPDMVVAVGTAAAKWLHKQLAPTVKLTYCMVSNPADALLTQGHPCLGVTTEVPISDQIQLLSQAIPHARSVGLLYRSDTAGGKTSLSDLQHALPDGWHVDAVAVNDYPSVAQAIDALMQKQVDIAWTTADQKLYDTACVRSLLLSAVRNKIPVWGYSLAFVRAGALLGTGVDPADQGRQAASLVIACINDPAAFKTRSIAPERFQIGVNLIVAEQIGIEIPEAVSHRATFIYQPEK